jgi:Co/Zn/Cd efflux system component
MNGHSFFSLFGSTTAVVLTENFEIYFVDAVSELTVALTLVDFSVPFLSEEIDALRMWSRKTDLKIVGRLIENVKDLHIWKAKEDLNVATFRMNRNCQNEDVTEVIEKLQKLVIRDSTIEI